MWVAGGTFVAITCCNVDAHLVPHRESPSDGKNLARVFPGRPDGTLTERVAHCIFEDFIKRDVTLYCDLHTAGQDMRMIPTIGYVLQPMPLNPSSVEQARVIRTNISGRCAALLRRSQEMFRAGRPPPKPSASRQSGQTRPTSGLRS